MLTSPEGESAGVRDVRGFVRRHGRFDARSGSAATLGGAARQGTTPDQDKVGREGGWAVLYPATYSAITPAYFQ